MGELNQCSSNKGWFLYQTPERKESQACYQNMLLKPCKLSKRAKSWQEPQRVRPGPAPTRGPGSHFREGWTELICHFLRPWKYKLKGCFGWTGRRPWPPRRGFSTSFAHLSAILVQSPPSGPGIYLLRTLPLSPAMFLWSLLLLSQSVFLLVLRDIQPKV